MAPDGHPLPPRTFLAQSSAFFARRLQKATETGRPTSIDSPQLRDTPSVDRVELEGVSLAIQPAAAWTSAVPDIPGSAASWLVGVRSDGSTVAPITSWRQATDVCEMNSQPRLQAPLWRLPVSPHGTPTNWVDDKESCARTTDLCRSSAHGDARWVPRKSSAGSARGRHPAARRRHETVHV